jgi:glycosyltransferase involved in cell wall biosynthesis
MRIALVYDRVNKWGGAERLLLTLHRIWPEAPLYTAVYNSKTAPWAADFKVIPSFLNKYPLAKQHHEAYPWLMPLAFESFDFSDYDLVISVTSEAAKGIITKPKTVHICFCLTPTRYLWSGYGDYFSNKIFRFLTRPVISYLRYWDKIAARRPDVFVAISENVRQRIKKYYGRDSEMIHPPVNTNKFKMQNSKCKMTMPRSKYFLLVSRLVGYKKIDIVIEAFNQLGLPLKIVGVGKDGERLKRMAAPNIEFLGQLTDHRLLDYYLNSAAVVFPQDEDFGLVPLEAQSCGRPVIAFRGGGALETVIENKTGLFFQPQTAEALIGVIRRFGKMKFNPAECRKSAQKFGVTNFEKQINGIIKENWRYKDKRSE